MSARRWEQVCAAGSWIATIVHVTLFYLHERADSPTAWKAARAMMDVGYWWEFCKTTGGWITLVIATAFSIAQGVLAFRRSRAA